MKKIKFVIGFYCILTFGISAWAQIDEAESIPQGWSYECSSEYFEKYKHSCVLKTSTGRIVLVGFSESSNVEAGRLIGSLKYGMGLNQSCYLWYVQPKPFAYAGPARTIIQKDWVIVRGLSAVEANLCSEVSSQNR